MKTPKPKWITIRGKYPEHTADLLAERDRLRELLTDALYYLKLDHDLKHNWDEKYKRNIIEVIEQALEPKGQVEK